MEEVLAKPLPDPDSLGWRENDEEDPPRLTDRLSLRSALRAHEAELDEQAQLPRSLVIHMRHVVAVDYSAAYGFSKLRQSCEKAGWRLVLCEMSAPVERVLMRSKCLVSGPLFHVRTNL